MTSKARLASSGYVVLNVLRVANIVALLLTTAASWIILLMTIANKDFYFFDGVSHVFCSFVSIFLIMSEVMLFDSFYVKNWPLLSSESGLVFLGFVMIMLGFNTLGNLNKFATSVENLGLPLWRLVISSGIITSLLGFLNIPATCIFSLKDQGINGRIIRKYGATAITKGKKDKLRSLSLSNDPAQNPVSPQLPMYTTIPKEPTPSRFRLPFGTRYFSPKKTDISLPTPVDPEKVDYLKERRSPIVPEMIRPPTAMHPAFNPSMQAPTSSSLYSDDSNPPKI